MVVTFSGIENTGRKQEFGGISRVHFSFSYVDILHFWEIWHAKHVKPDLAVWKSVWLYLPPLHGSQAWAVGLLGLESTTIRTFMLRLVYQNHPAGSWSISFLASFELSFHPQALIKVYNIITIIGLLLLGWCIRNYTRKRENSFESCLFLFSNIIDFLHLHIRKTKVEETTSVLLYYRRNWISENCFSS